ncbi:hypothetical protein [Pseudomonas fluorescens]|uniref:hypothetical protein n=1 Tax=Pseudomonas fluorescens TaxID=294 RepID=UPI001BE7A9A2|nr:hypothetical protein [Pseudomonas fluorescens]MBT2374787.1 hypothetical protein [Pseudomonas fluorescens]
MMLLRTLVLERSGHDTPVNGALLCGFSVAQVSSNFLAYSLDEEAEPGSSRVYIAALRKKSERYFLGGIDSKSDLQVAMHVFKQILTLAAGPGSKSGSASEPQIPYHFVDLKGCKLPPARPEDHHSLTIKKTLVMKVITLGTSVPGLPAIESTSLIVPSIRFSSRMVAPPRAGRQVEPESREMLLQASAVAPVAQQLAESVQQAQVEPILETVLEESPPETLHPVPDQQVREAPECETAPISPVAKEERVSLFEVDNTLTNLARVAQELTQQKNTVLKQEEELGQARSLLLQEKADWELTKQQDAGLACEKELALQQQAQMLNTREEQLLGRAEGQQAEQRRLEEWAHDLERQAIELHSHDLAVRHREEQLAVGLSHLSRFRAGLREVLHNVDEVLGSGHDQAVSVERQLQADGEAPV